MIVKEADFMAQAGTSVRLGEHEADKLAAGGWTKERNQGLRERLANYEEVTQRFYLAREERMAATRTFKAAVGGCMAFRGKLIVGLKLATQGQPYPFAKPRLQLSRSRTPIAAGQWFLDVMVLVEKHRAALRPLFPSDPVELTLAYASKLRSAISQQETRGSRIYGFSAERREARIQLAAAMQQQRLAAAFAGDKALLRQFVPIWEQRRLWKKARKRAADAGADPTGPAQAEVAEPPVTGTAPPGSGP